MPADYFALLGFEPSFELDLATLEKSYFAVQRQCHPDRFVGKPQAERMAAMQRSVDINQAYQVLKTPLTRAQHLLVQHGVIVGTEADSVKPSQALLVEVIELRENLPDAKTIAQMVEASINRIGKHFTAAEWVSMAQETLRLGYLIKIQEEVSR